MSAPPNPCYLCRPDKGGNVLVALYLDVRQAMPCEWICAVHARQLLDSPLFAWAQQPPVTLIAGAARRVG